MNSLAVSAISPLAARRRRLGRVVLWGFGLVLVVAFLLAVGYGALAIGPGQAAAILAAQLGIELPWLFGRQEEAVLLAIRLPRALGILDFQSTYIVLKVPHFLPWAGGQRRRNCVSLHAGGRPVAIVDPALLVDPAVDRGCASHQRQCQH